MVSTQATDTPNLKITDRRNVDLFRRLGNITSFESAVRLSFFIYFAQTREKEAFYSGKSLFYN
jgi:hypothetical protein